ncbi:hypothetical protein [Kitasatospora kifunensis]|uniref:DUF8175 domain-containing protein n=1 Tax=Kitasatospora kifunensis TaxID=58351 RepID=A0A7W7W0U0_KITKI|nr:hypothetical protein [Kitasatospora kifunensis]MBB4929054.1 hypothetical protein [Kitasatospora kifunensis]
MTDHQAPPAEPKDRTGGWWGSPGTAFAAVGVLSVVALAGVWVGFSGGSSKHSPAALPAPNATPTAAAPSSGALPSTASSSDCPQLADTSQAQPDQRSFAGDVTWAAFGSYQLPVSKQSGPAVVSGDVARCYAHTPRGAVIALMNSSVRSANATDWRSVVEQEVLPGPERDTYSGFVAASRGNGATPPQASLAQYAGFNVVSYTSDTAVVDVVLSFPASGYKSILLTAVWSNGDWRQKMTTDGQQSSSYRALNTLAGYIPFSPTGS